MSLRDHFFKRQQEKSAAQKQEDSFRAASVIDSKLDAFANTVHDALEDYFARLDSGRAPGWLLRRRMESLFTLCGVTADAFTPDVLQKIEGYEKLRAICAGGDIDTALDIRFCQEGKDVVVAFYLQPDMRFPESKLMIDMGTQKSRIFNADTGEEILPAAPAPKIAEESNIIPSVETDSSITVKKPLTLKREFF